MRSARIKAIVSVPEVATAGAGGPNTMLYIPLSKIKEQQERTYSVRSLSVLVNHVVGR